MRDPMYEIYKVLRKKKFFSKLFFPYCVISASFIFLFFLFAMFIQIKDSIKNVDKSLSYVYTFGLEPIDFEVNTGEIKINDIYEYVDCSTGIDKSLFLIDGKRIEVNLPIKYYSVDYDKDIFPKYNTMEYFSNYKSDLIYGNYPEKENEILIDEILLDNLGYSIGEIIGKQINIYLPESIIMHAGEVLYKDLKVSGVICREYHNIASNKNIGSMIYLSSNLPKKDFVQEIHYINIYFDDAENYNQLIQYLSEHTNLSFFYANINRVISSVMINKFINVLAAVLLMVIMVTFVLALLSLVNYSGEFLHKEKKFLFIVFAYGLSKHKIKYLVLFICMNLLIKSFICASILSLPVLITLSGILKNNFIPNFSMNINITFITVLFSFIFSFFFVILSNIISFVFNRKKIF